MKNLFLAIFLILLTNTLFGQNLSDVIDNVGGEILPLRYELDISEGFQLNHEFSVGLLSYYFENLKSGFGFETRLPKYYYSSNNHIISFFGANIYWNILNLGYNDNFIKPTFGPVFSIDYLNWNLSESFSTMFYNYILKIGIRFSILRSVDDGFFMPLINFETGYKNTNGINNIYLSIQINASAVALLLDAPMLLLLHIYTNKN